jgi:hypothetical protein
MRLRRFLCITCISCGIVGCAPTIPDTLLGGSGALRANVQQVQEGIDAVSAHVETVRDMGSDLLRRGTDVKNGIAEMMSGAATVQRALR